MRISPPVIDIFVRSHGIHKPALSCPKEHVLKDFRKSVQNGTSSLRQLADFPWPSDNHLVCHRSGRSIYQSALSYWTESLESITGMTLNY